MDAHQLNALGAVDCGQVYLTFSKSPEKVHFKTASSADLCLWKGVYTSLPAFVQGHRGSTFVSLKSFCRCGSMEPSLL